MFTNDKDWVRTLIYAFRCCYNNFSAIKSLNAYCEIVATRRPFFFRCVERRSRWVYRFRKASSLYMHECSKKNRSDRWCSKTAERYCIRSSAHAGAYAFGYMRAKRRNRQREKEKFVVFRRKERLSGVKKNIH